MQTDGQGTVEGTLVEVLLGEALRRTLELGHKVLAFKQHPYRPSVYVSRCPDCWRTVGVNPLPDGDEGHINGMAILEGCRPEQK